MQAKAIYNGIDLARWAAEDGIIQSTVFRASRSVTTLTGELHRCQVPKRAVTIDLVEMRDSTLRQIAEAIVPQGTLEYTDRDLGERSAEFYAYISSATQRSVRGGNTYWRGVRINLEEV